MIITIEQIEMIDRKGIRFSNRIQLKKSLLRGIISIK
jgi:hypothetical protein